MTAAVVPLLATKLFAPRPRRDLVARPRLLARLDAGLDTARCTLVSAPAGAGKTTAVAAWLATVDRRVAWLTLDDRDQDVQQVVRYLAAALGAASLPAADGPPLPPEVTLTRLLNDLAVAAPSVLVLDDYHVVREQAVHAAVGFLVEHLVPSLHLVITTREDPPLPLPRMRGRGELVELRAHDLAFGIHEATALLASLPLDGAQVQALVDRTEGWAAGLQIAGLALRDRADPAAFVAGFTGGHRLVIDYITAEIIDRQPPDVRRFLLATAVLDRFCAPLCDAVVDTALGAGEILERLERDNLFLVPLDDDRTWFRYHRLFADALTARSTREVDDAAEVHRRAGDWFAGERLLPEAIRHALTAGATADAAARLEALLPAVFVDTSSHATLRAWLAELPEPLSPPLRLMRAWLAIHELDYATAGAWLGAGAGGAVDVTRAFLVAVGPTGSAEEVAALAERGLTALPADDSVFRAVGRYCLAQAAFAMGRLDRAEQTFAEAASAAAAIGLGHGELTSTTHRVNVARLRGRRRHALAAARAALSRWDERIGPPSVGLLHSATAELLLDGDDLAAALPAATEGLRIQRVSGNAPPLVLMASLPLARLRLAEDDPDAAAAVLADVPPLTGAFAHLQPLLDAADAQVCLARGDAATRARLGAVRRARGARRLLPVPGPVLRRRGGGHVRRARADPARRRQARRDPLWPRRRRRAGRAAAAGVAAPAHRDPARGAGRRARRSRHGPADAHRGRPRRRARRRRPALPGRGATAGRALRPAAARPELRRRAARPPCRPGAAGRPAGRAADVARGRRAAAARGGPLQRGHRGHAVRRAEHREDAPHPRLRQARRAQPRRSGPAGP